MALVRQLSFCPSGFEDYSRYFRGHRRHGGRAGSHGRSSCGAVERRKQRFLRHIGRRSASGHYFDGAIIPELQVKLDSYQVLDVPRKITTAGGGQLDGVAQGLLRDIVVDGKELWRSVQLSCFVVSGPGCNLFSVKHAARNGIVFIFYMDSTRL